MFIAEASGYTSPVTELEDLAGQFPAVPDTVDMHVLTIKVCNSPDLLGRLLDSVDEHAAGKVTPLVVDDSATLEAKTAMRAVAEKRGVAYHAIRGEDSLTSRFLEYLQATSGDELSDYFRRIVTTHGRDPDSGEWGGVNGAQNMGHLASIMTFGKAGVPPEKWLSTFVDHDIVLPKSAPDILRMIAIYHNMGRVGIIASDYTHHSGSPTEIGQRALSRLAARLDGLSPDQIDQRLLRIMQRNPDDGLLDEAHYGYKYSTAGLSMDFPAGNYTLSGPDGFEVPVPIVGLEDQGYGAMLQIFKGAREMGVARVPGFMHIRQPNATAINGTLDSYFTSANRYATHDALLDQLLQFATANGMPEQRIADFRLLQGFRRTRQLASMRGLAEAALALASDERLDAHAATLRRLAQDVARFAHARYRQVVRTPLDDSVPQLLFVDAPIMQPKLVRAAYEFGAAGGLEHSVAK